MASSIPLLETIEITLSASGVAELCFNRPNKYNALSPTLYTDWMNGLKWAAGCDAVKVVVLTGRGKYFTSGQELATPDTTPAGKEFIKHRRNITKSLVDELIKFPKLLIAAVNGPAIGFGVTSLALCDVVYCVPEATFMTPFMKLAFCAEACSSHTFPKIMGASKASEMLLMGRSFTSEEMVACGFVSRTIPKDGFRQQVLDIAEEAAKFSVSAVAVTKKLIRSNSEELLAINEEEMKQISIISASQDSIDAINHFVAENKKKKAAKAAKQQRSRI